VERISRRGPRSEWGSQSPDPACNSVAAVKASRTKLKVKISLKGSNRGSSTNLWQVLVVLIAGIKLSANAQR